MEQKAVLERTPTANGLAAAIAPGEPSVLSVMVVYQDGQTRTWAGESFEQLTGLVGQESVRTTWWKAVELNEPGVLAGAVSTAMRADVIVVAVHAQDELPLAFYVWAESWLPNRLHSSGTLIALINLPHRPSPDADRARKYLTALAQQARMGFLLRERRLSAPVAASVPKAG